MDRKMACCKKTRQVEPVERRPEGEARTINDLRKSREIITPCTKRGGLTKGIHNGNRSNSTGKSGKITQKSLRKKGNGSPSS